MVKYEHQKICSLENPNPQNPNLQNPNPQQKFVYFSIEIVYNYLMTLKTFFKILALIIIVAGLLIAFYFLVYDKYLNPNQDAQSAMDSQATVSKSQAIAMKSASSEEFEVTFTYSDAMLTNSSIYVTEIDKTQSQIKVKNGTRYGSLPVPVMDGKVFSGWYTSEFGGERVLGNDEVDLTTNQALYAHWTAEEDADKAELPILMYHWFYEDGKEEYGMASNANWMNINEFESHMEYLSEENYYFPTWEEVAHFASGELVLPEKSIVINVDDGQKNFFKLAIPVLDKYEINATGFLITSTVKDKTIEKYNSDNIDLRSHSHNMHIRESGGRGRVYSMEMHEIVADLNQSKEKLGKGYVFCYPFGHYSDNLKEALSIEGYELAVTIENGKVRPGTDKLQLPRVRISSGTTVEMFKKLIEDESSQN